MQYSSSVADHPGKYLRQHLDEKGWTQDELAAVTGYSRQTINAIASGKGRITPEMAVTLGAAFGNDAAEWLKWDSEHQLSLVSSDATSVERMARLYDLAPIHDMQRRGWIPKTDSVSELESVLSRFFAGDISRGVTFPVAMHRTANLAGLTSAEKAWCFRARQMAQSLHVAEFSNERLPAAAKKLRQLAAYPQEARRLPDILGYYGIRFVIVEPIPDVKVDGAAFWVDENPTIAVSARWDRIDAFWFTVMHEFAHVKNGDAFSVDVNLINEEDRGVVTVPLASAEAERKANEDAAESLIPQAELESFIQRLAPLFPATRIIQFANKVRMHPGIIVGQLQHRRQLRYNQHRDFLVKIRGIITETALTDGWGHQIGVGLTT